MQPQLKTLPTLFVKLSAGADLVQLITGMVYNGPQLIGQITQYLSENNSSYSSLSS